MYAVVDVGARQYSVKKGDIIEVEHVDTQEDKDKVEVGQPYLKSVKVKALILEHLKGEKVISYKYKRRKSSHWKKGHRQNLTRLQISSIDTK
jgi:large subunit ribosomal protein L21